MVEFVYETEMHEAEVLVSNTYKNFTYKIVSYGTHPCCYVEIPEEHKFYKKDYYDEIGDKVDCHGGLTFSKTTDFGDGDRYYIGWDYAHAGDYMGYYEHKALGPKSFWHDQKKYTMEELIEDCKKVIEQL